MTPFTKIFAGFLLGLLIGSSVGPVQRRLVGLPSLQRLHDTISSRGFPPICYNSYSDWPLSVANNIGSMPPTQHPVPGLAHLTVTGRTHTGNREIEMWYETVAPGGGTPIHRHDCEEIFLVLSGTGTMRIQGADGHVVSQKLPINGTITVLPNARHQFFNEGDEDVSFIVAFDNLPMRPTIFPSWEVPDSAGKEFAPLPWDAHCPSETPDASKLMQRNPSGDDRSEL